MPSYLTDLIDRACAIEREAFATLTPPLAVDAVARFFYVGEAFPYLTHRVTGLAIDHSDNSESEQFPQPRLIMRCVVGHITSGYAGENENVIYSYIPLLTSYLANRKWFQSAAYPARPDLLMSSEVVDAGGLRAFDNSGFAGVIQVGFEITIACIFTEFIEQVYL